MIFLLTFFAFMGIAQEKDTTKPIMVKEHSPKKAMIYSAILPGAGQVYNKKWWKVPIVYGAIGSCLYLGVNNNSEYVTRFAELSYRIQSGGDSRDPAFANYSDAQLTEEMDYHRKWRDNFFVFTGLAYILNIVDASVDAHFYSFDVSDDLTVSFRPFNQFSFDKKWVSGLSLTISLK